MSSTSGRDRLPQRVPSSTSSPRPSIDDQRPPAAAVESQHGSQVVAGDGVEQQQLESQQQQQQQHDEQVANKMPPFEPLFTLLTNTTTNTTIHPRVRYIFNDDDPSILNEPPPSHSATSEQQQHQLQESQQQDRRAVVVDLAPTPDNSAWAVSWSSSLSPDFALTQSRVSVQEQQQQQQSQPQSQDEAGSATTMLRIEGVEREPVSLDGPKAAESGSLPSSRSEAAVAGGREDVGGLVDEFRRRMGVLSKVVDEGERRRDVVGRLAGEHQDQHNQPAEQEQETREPETSSGVVPKTHE